MSLSSSVCLAMPSWSSGSGFIVRCVRTPLKSKRDSTGRRLHYHFLAPLDEVQEELLYTPGVGVGVGVGGGVGVSKMLKFLR